MIKKVCFKCKENKPLSDYYRHPGMRDCHLNKCKDCNKKESRSHQSSNKTYYRKYDLERYRGDFVRIFLHKYSTMKQRVEGRGSHNYSSKGKEIISKNEFFIWCYKTKNYNKFVKLYDEWEKSGWKKSLSPSIDRITNSKGYTLDNMQWITHSQNSSKH